MSEPMRERALAEARRLGATRFTLERPLILALLRSGEVPPREGQSQVAAGRFDARRDGGELQKGRSDCPRAFGALGAVGEDASLDVALTLSRARDHPGRKRCKDVHPPDARQRARALSN